MKVKKVELKKGIEIAKIYVKKRKAYYREMKQYIKEKKKYSMNFFKRSINKNPELLQTVEFNKKIVKYRAESIYRITQNSIRPNQHLNKLIWSWIAERNAKNKAARLYFKKETNFRFI